MKIVFTGGGTGGHFYPLMAVAESVLDLCKKEKLIDPKLYYFSSDVINPRELYNRNIIYSFIPSGKKRNYFSFLNFLDLFKVFFGIIIAFMKLLKLYPDVVFSKGGYDSLPTCIAAWLLKIPIIMHESDSVPGRTNLFMARFSDRIAVSFKEAVSYFDIKKTAWTGQPIIKRYLPQDGWIKNNPPIRANILISGGSQGSQRINDFILNNLEYLCGKYNLVHQTGELNIEDVKSRASVILGNYSGDTYLPVGSMDFSKVYPYIDLVIARAGSSLFEYAAWNIPSILIPLPESANNHQYQNASIAMKYGFSDVILEENMNSSILIEKIKNILDYSNNVNSLYDKMKNASKSFAKLNASETIAREIVRISLRIK